MQSNHPSVAEYKSPAAHAAPSGGTFDGLVLCALLSAPSSSSSTNNSWPLVGSLSCGNECVCEQGAVVRFISNMRYKGLTVVSSVLVTAC